MLLKKLDLQVTFWAASLKFYRSLGVHSWRITSPPVSALRLFYVQGLDFCLVPPQPWRNVDPLDVQVLPHKLD